MQKKKPDGSLDDQTGVFVLDPNRMRELRKTYGEFRIQRKATMLLYPVYANAYRLYASEEYADSRNATVVYDLDAKTLKDLKEKIKKTREEIEGRLKTSKRQDFSDIKIPDEETLTNRITDDIEQKLDEEEEEIRFPPPFLFTPQGRSFSNSGGRDSYSFITDPSYRRAKHRGTPVPKDTPFEIRDIEIIMNEYNGAISRYLGAIRKESTNFWRDRLNSIVHEGQTQGKRSSMCFSKEIFPFLCDFREYLKFKRMVRPPHRDRRSPEEMTSTWWFWKSLKTREGEDAQWMNETPIPGSPGWVFTEEKTRERTPKIRKVRTAPQRRKTTPEATAALWNDGVTSKDFEDPGFPEL